MRTFCAAAISIAPTHALRVVSEHYSAGDFSTLSAAAPLLEDVYLLLTERRQDKFGTLGVLSLLAISGYFADRRYAALYGDHALAALSDVLRLSLARRLARFLGAKLALIVALADRGRRRSGGGKTAPRA